MWKIPPWQIAAECNVLWRDRWREWLGAKAGPTKRKPAPGSTRQVGNKRITRLI